MRKLTAKNTKFLYEKPKKEKDGSLRAMAAKKEEEERIARARLGRKDSEISEE